MVCREIRDNIEEIRAIVITIKKPKNISILTSHINLSTVLPMT